MKALPPPTLYTFSSIIPVQPYMLPSVSVLVQSGILHLTAAKHTVLAISASGCQYAATILFCFCFPRYPQLEACLNCSQPHITLCSRFQGLLGTNGCGRLEGSRLTDIQYPQPGRSPFLLHRWELHLKGQSKCTWCQRI